MEIEKQKKLASLVYRLSVKQCSEQDFIDFCYLTIDFVYRKEHDVDIVIEDELSNENFNAEYDIKNNKIRIARKTIKNFLKGEIPFLNFVDTIGHEFEHYLQYKAFKDIKSGKVKEDKLSKSWRETIYSTFDKYFDKNDVQTVFNYLRLNGNKYIAEIWEKSPQEVMQFIKDVAFSQYSQLKFEENARDGGILFTHRALQKFINLEGIDLGLKDWLKRLKNWHTINACKFERETRKNYSLWNLFEKSMSEIDLKKLEEFEHAGDSVETLAKMVYFSYKNKSKQELENIFFANLSNDTHAITNGLFLLINKKSTRQEFLSFQKELENNVKNCQLPKNSCYSILKNYLEGEQLCDVIQDLFAQGKVDCVLPYLDGFRIAKMKGAKFDNNEVAFVYKSLQSYLNDVNKKIQKGKGKDIILDDVKSIVNLTNNTFSTIFFEDDGIRLKDKKKFNKSLAKVNDWLALQKSDEDSQLQLKRKLYGDTYLGLNGDNGENQLTSGEVGC